MAKVAPSGLWGPIDMRKWRATPCIRGRLAVEADVAGGSAVYYIENTVAARPFEMELPRCAVLHDEKTGRGIPVIVVQAECHEDHAGPSLVIGYRFLNGGNGICMLSEVDLLAKPDRRFQRFKPAGAKRHR